MRHAKGWWDGVAHAGRYSKPIAASLRCLRIAAYSRRLPRRSTSCSRQRISTDPLDPSHSQKPWHSLHPSIHPSTSPQARPIYPPPPPHQPDLPQTNEQTNKTKRTHKLTPSPTPTNNPSSAPPRNKRRGTNSSACDPSAHSSSPPRISPSPGPCSSRSVRAPRPGGRRWSSWRRRRGQCR